MSRWPVIVGALAVLGTACGGAAPTTTGAATELPTTTAESARTVPPETTSTSIAETGGSVPDVDLTRAIVDLGEVYFDTFDGGSVRLSNSDEALRRRLLDAIPPIDDPVYGSVADGDWLDDNDLVLGYEAGGEAYAYPLKILNFHEIVNDVIDGVPVLISYCPLCRSGIVYDRRLGDRTLDFGNTSALYESDLVMVDRQTGTYWWQVAGRAIVGTLAGEELVPLPSATTTWAEWKADHPGSRVLTRDTGFDRPYERDVFSGYEAAVDAGRFVFPIGEASRDPRLSASEVVLGVALGGTHRVYPLETLGDAAVNDDLAGSPVVVFSTGAGPSGAAFSPVVEGMRLTFTRAGSSWTDDQTGTSWNLAGEAVDGELAGARLEPVPSRTTFWFAYVGAFPDAEVHAGS